MVRRLLTAFSLTALALTSIHLWAGCPDLNDTQNYARSEDHGDWTRHQTEDHFISVQIAGTTSFRNTSQRDPNDGHIICTNNSIFNVSATPGESGALSPTQVGSYYAHNPGPTPIYVCPPGTKEDDYSNALTSPENGVEFQFFPTELAVKISWLNKDSGCGWVVRRDPNTGVVYTGKQLAGNLMWQADTVTNPLCQNNGRHAGNGFCAMMVMDEIEQSGDHNGLFDPNDGAWNKPWNDGKPEWGIWVPNGSNVFRMADFHTFDEFRITAFDVAHFKPTKRTDKYGNAFVFCGTMKQDGKDVGICDAVLKTAQ
jgi:hypothetical protein